MAHTYFLFITEYGAFLGIQKLLDMWLLVSHDSQLNQAIRQYFFVILSKDLLPLSMIKDADDAFREAIVYQAEGVINRSLNPNQKHTLLQGFNKSF